MNDTSQNVKDLQLKIWLSKSPGERLMQFMKDNASLFQFWAAARNSYISLEGEAVGKTSSNQK
jgi:hypothetical protein